MNDSITLKAVIDRARATFTLDCATPVKTAAEPFRIRSAVGWRGQEQAFATSANMDDANKTRIHTRAERIAKIPFLKERVMLTAELSLI